MIIKVKIMKIEINNLVCQQFIVDFEKEIFIVHCLDIGTTEPYEKSYYKEVSEPIFGELSTQKDLIIDIMRSGWKLKLHNS